MAKEFRFFSIKDANAEIKAACDTIHPLLTSANISTIEVNGRPMPATSDDVPTSLKIAAFAGTVKEGSADKQLSQVLADNQILANQAGALEARAVTAETTAQSALSEKAVLDTQLATERASVARLTAENAELTNLRNATNTRAAHLTEQNQALNGELSRHCLALNCLADLRDGGNELLPSSASAEQKQAAADRIPAADKIKALCGAVNSALQRTGVDISRLPGGELNIHQSSGTGILAQYEAEKAKGSAAGVAFYRKNAEAIDAAYRAK